LFPLPSGERVRVRGNLPGLGAEAPSGIEPRDKPEADTVPQIARGVAEAGDLNSVRTAGLSQLCES
jgi:hypothetical protein